MVPILAHTATVLVQCWHGRARTPRSALVPMTNPWSRNTATKLNDIPVRIKYVAPRQPVQAKSSAGDDSSRRFDA
jgi:hypothetical protein